MNILHSIGAGVATIGLFIASLFGYTPITEAPLGVALPSGTADFESSLAVGISDSATTMTLVSNSIRGGGSLSGYECFTIDEGSAQEEYVCGTASSTSVTGLERGLSPADGVTETTGLKFAHRRGASVKITDFPLIQRIASQNSGDATFENVLSYANGVTPTSGNHLADVDYVLNTITGTSTLSYDSTVVGGTAGETFATGTIVYLKASDSRWYKADNDITSTYVDQTLGIAQNAVTTGNGVSVLTYGLDSTQVGMTGGNFIFLSATAGATSTATTSQILGKAISATTMFFDQNLIDSSVYVPTTFSGASTFTGTTNLSGMTYGGFYATATASTTFTGASSPQASFITASGTASTSMSSATSTAGFSGFAVTNASAGEIVKIQTEGIVTGFSGLTKGVTYYTQTTNGTIGTTFTSTAVPVGIAISSTELLIQKGKRIYLYTSPTLTDSGNAGATVLTTNINVGFIPRNIRIISPSDPASASNQHTAQEWVSGTLIGNAGMYYVSSISTPTLNGFTLTIVQGVITPINSNLYMIIEE
jgi:hypothetical protein